MIGKDQDEASLEQQLPVNLPAVSPSTNPSDGSQGIRLGSLWVSYVESYYEASLKLSPPGQKLVYPVLYLQRHTFELLVKEILSALLEIRSELQTLDELFGTLCGAGPVEATDENAASSTHSFDNIFASLDKNLERLGCPPLPSVFCKTRELFDSVDNGRPDRLRYSLTWNKTKRTLQPSFAHEFDPANAKYAPCDQVSELLSQIMSARKR